MSLSEFLYLLPGFWFYVIEKEISPTITLSDTFTIIKALVISLGIKLIVYIIFYLPIIPYKYSDLSSNHLLFIMFLTATILALSWAKIKTTKEYKKLWNCIMLWFSNETYAEGTNVFVKAVQSIDGKTCVYVRIFCNNGMIYEGCNIVYTLNPDDDDKEILLNNVRILSTKNETLICTRILDKKDTVYINVDSISSIEIIKKEEQIFPEITPVAIVPKG